MLAHSDSLATKGHLRAVRVHCSGILSYSNFFAVITFKNT